MRLLSFLTEVERAILTESPVIDGGAWESSRMVNFQQRLGRIFLSGRSPATAPFPGGSIFIQAFVLADGSQCLKATLGWKDTACTSSLAVYSKPDLDWRTEASRVAAAWLEGPPVAAQDSTSAADLAPLGAA